MKLLQTLNRHTDGYILTDKGRWHHYLRVYDILLLPFRDKEINLFEVGFYGGGSCLLWEKYFPKAHIKCVEIDKERMKDYNRTKSVSYNKYFQRTTLDIMDANDLTAEYFDDFIPDIAIDDGSHKLFDQVNFIKTVYPVLREGGILFVEDIQDIDKDKPYFDQIGIPYDIADNRRSSGMSDDVLLIFKK
jgi:hypothetical protein